MSNPFDFSEANYGKAAGAIESLTIKIMALEMAVRLIVAKHPDVQASLQKMSDKAVENLMHLPASDQTLERLRDQLASLKTPPP